MNNTTPEIPTTQQIDDDSELFNLNFKKVSTKKKYKKFGCKKSLVRIEYTTCLDVLDHKDFQVIAIKHDLKLAQIIRVLWNWFSNLEFKLQRQFVDNTDNEVKKIRGMKVKSIKTCFLEKDARKIEEFFLKWNTIQKEKISFKKISYKLQKWFIGLGDLKIKTFKRLYYDKDTIAMLAMTARTKNLSYQKILELNKEKRYNLITETEQNKEKFIKDTDKNFFDKTLADTVITEEADFNELEPSNEE